MPILHFTHTHDYSHSAGIEVPVRLGVSGRRPLWIHAKVDTGASFCIFRREYAEELGLSVEDGPSLEISTATGHFTVFGHTVQMECLGYSFESFLYFAGHEGFRRDVLGRVGWLNRFRIGIVEHDTHLYLSAYDE
ncbi:MAG: retropepsin-like domain-containing protein [Bryobacterales bacterium]|nr:retropepsin-like domain-containing protein [Bryobacterales bacterium]